MAANPRLTFEALCNWIEGRLAPEEASAVAALVAEADETTQREVAWLRALQQASDEIVLADPPAQIHAKLVAQFADYAASKQPPSLFQRLVAALTFDSWQQGALAGVRSASSDVPRQLIYSTELADVVLNIQWPEVGAHANLFGQLLPTQVTLVPELFAVQLLAGEREIGITMADETGEFVFEGVAAGSYQLNFSSDDALIVLPTLEMQRPTP